MNTQSILEALRAMEFFHDIGDEHLQRLAEIAQAVEFPGPNYDFSENDSATDVTSSSAVKSHW